MCYFSTNANEKHLILSLAMEKTQALKSLSIFIISLNAPIPDEKKKLTLISTLLCGASKGFMKALSSVEIRI